MAKRAARTSAKTAPAAAHPAAPGTWPRWVPAAVYAVATLVLFRAFIFSSDMLYGSDTLSLGYAARLFYAEALRAGTFPFWNPLILGGTPFLESLAGGDSLYPTSLLLLFVEPYRALGWKLVVHVFLAGLFMYGWLRALGSGRPAALVAGLAYLMAPFMVSLVYPGHDGKLFVTALTPLAFWAAERVLTGGGARWFAALAGTVGVVILSTHFQMAYFLFGALGVYMIVRTAAAARVGEGAAAGRRALLFLGAALLGAGVAAVQLLPAVDYVTESSRRTATTTAATSDVEGVAYSSSYSLHPEEALGFLAPEFVGNGVADGADWASGTYWGRNPIKLGHPYFGVVVLLLAGVGLLVRARGVVHWTLFGIGTVAFLYGLGTHTPVWRVFYEVVPGISLFRAPDMVVFLTGFAAVTLAGLGLDALLAPDGLRWKGVQRWMWGLVGLLGLLTVLAASGILQSFWLAVVYPQADPGRIDRLTRLQPYLVRGFAVSTVLAGLSAGLMVLYRDARVSAGGLIAGLALLVGIDAIRIDDTFITTFDVRTWAAPDPNMRFLEGQESATDPWRLLSLAPPIGQDVKPALYGLELAAGHHPNDLARYRELIGMQGSGRPENLLANPTLLRLLNVRYLLWPQAQLGGPPMEGVQPLAATQLQDGRIYEAVYPWNDLPRARLVADAVIQPDDQAVAYMMSPAFDPTTQVVLPETPPRPLPGGPVQGEVTWETRGINAMTLRVRSDREALLVVADNWYPAWSARVDGQAAPVLRAYHTLRAVPVPAGESTVEMYYDTASLRGPFLLSLVSLLLLGVALVWPALRRGRSGDGESAA
ncbi:MAG: hypothetical protein R3E98_11315 [Gemmatimonadota bacterium]